jgi:hypothetical protein
MRVLQAIPFESSEDQIKQLHCSFFVERGLRSRPGKPSAASDAPTNQQLILFVFRAFLLSLLCC